jgi:hypothetical protein
MITDILNISEIHDVDICKDIKESSYTQHNLEDKEKYNDLTDMIIAYNDPNYSLLPVKDKTLYLKQKRIEIASEVEEKNMLDDLHFNKYLSLKKIQSGLTLINCISSLFFLSEYYKSNITIVNIKKKVYYRTLKEHTNKMIIEQKDDYWSLSDDTSKSGITPTSLKDFDILDKDIISYDIYDIPLKPFSSYKLTDLQGLANECGIDTKINNKNKVKNILYEELRTYFLNLI